MYLIHNTTLKYAKSILKDEVLKSNKMTGNINEGEGVYDTNAYVYFSTTSILFDKNTMGGIIIYLSSELLFNRTFYVLTLHSNFPNYLMEHKNGKYIQYKRKYPRYYENYNKILKDLYTLSIATIPNGVAFQAFNQVAIKNKINIKKYIKGIQFNILKSRQKEYIPIIKYVKSKYPNIKIKINLK